MIKTVSVASLCGASKGSLQGAGGSARGGAKSAVKSAARSAHRSGSRATPRTTAVETSIKSASTDSTASASSSTARAARKEGNAALSTVAPRSASPSQAVTNATAPKAATRKRKADADEKSVQNTTRTAIIGAKNTLGEKTRLDNPSKRVSLAQHSRKESSKALPEVSGETLSDTPKVVKSKRARRTPAKTISNSSEAVAQRSGAREESQSSATVARPKVEPVKPKRARVPSDLAEQYGATETRRVGKGEPVTSAPEAAEPMRKRLSKTEREARRALMRPDEELLERLQRVESDVPARKKNPKTAGRGWQFECGRCGRVARIPTPAALCVCGAMAMRDGSR